MKNPRWIVLTVLFGLLSNVGFGEDEDIAIYGFPNGSTLDRITQAVNGSGAEQIPLTNDNELQKFLEKVRKSGEKDRVSQLPLLHSNRWRYHFIPD